MKVKCIVNDTSIKQKKAGLTEFYSGSLLLDKEYVVYSIGEISGGPWFCICDEDFSYYPMFRFHGFFEISDPWLSRFWVFEYHKNSESKKFIDMSFPEWVYGNFFYSNLVDGEEPALSLFRKYKALMDLEFPDTSVSDSAKILDDDWLMCPICIDAWETRNTLDGMLKCPMKGHLLHNPKYIPRDLKF